VIDNGGIDASRPPRRQCSLHRTRTNITRKASGSQKECPPKKWVYSTSCALCCPLANPHWPHHRSSDILLLIFNLRVLMFMSQPRVSVALVLDNPQHSPSGSDDDVPTMCPRASTSRQVFPTSTKDSELIGNAITRLTNSTYAPFTFPGAYLY